jgi:hypothetical protein
MQAHRAICACEQPEGDNPAEARLTHQIWQGLAVAGGFGVEG